MRASFSWRNSQGGSLLSETRDSTIKTDPHPMILRQFPDESIAVFGKNLSNKAHFCSRQNLHSLQTWRSNTSVYGDLGRPLTNATIRVLTG